MDMKQYLAVLLFTLFFTTQSTLYSVNDKYEVTFEKSYNELAHCTYEERIYEKGWNYLHIYANPQRNLLEQHRGAGFIEGYSTYK